MSRDLLIMSGTTTPLATAATAPVAPMIDHTSNSGSYRIEPLKGAKNYISWHVQIFDILNDLGLWNYVDGTILMPTNDLDATLKWHKKDWKALIAIHLWITPTMMTYVLSATTSKGAYDALANMFNVQGALAKVLA